MRIVFNVITVVSTGILSLGLLVLMAAPFLPKRF